MSKVIDLGQGNCGIIEFKDGARYFCMSVEPAPDAPHQYLIRIESGWYERYTRDGKSINPSRTRAQIIDFIPMSSLDKRAWGLPTEITP